MIVFLLMYIKHYDCDEICDIFTTYELAKQCLEDIRKRGVTVTPYNYYIKEMKVIGASSM